MIQTILGGRAVPDGSPTAPGSVQKGTLIWQVTNVPAGTARVEFRIDADGSHPDGVAGVWIEQFSPYQWQGDPAGRLDTTKLKDGVHKLGVRCYRNATRVKGERPMAGGQAACYIRVANTPQPSTSPSSSVSPSRSRSLSPSSSGSASQSRSYSSGQSFSPSPSPSPSSSPSPSHAAPGIDRFKGICLYDKSVSQGDPAAAVRLAGVTVARCDWPSKAWCDNLHAAGLEVLPIADYAQGMSLARAVASGNASHAMIRSALDDPDVDVEEWDPVAWRAKARAHGARPEEEAMKLAASLGVDHAPPRDMAAWAAHLATDYVAKWGSPPAVEIWNEPWGSGFWQPTPDPDAYYRLVVESCKALWAVNPHCIVVVASDATGNTNTKGTDKWRVNLLAADTTGLLADPRIRPSTHNYCDARSPETHTSSPNSWDFDRYEGCYDDYLRHGHPDPQVWVTEWGWQAGAGSALIPYTPVSEQQQADYTVRGINMARASGKVEAMHNFYFQTSNSWNYNWLRTDNSPKPVCAAVKPL